MAGIDLDDIVNQVRPLLRKHGVVRAGVFGSWARREPDARDVDLLIALDRKISLLDFIGIKQDIEDRLQLSVDLVSYDAIKPALRDEILRDEIPIL